MTPVSRNIGDWINVALGKNQACLDDDEDGDKDEDEDDDEDDRNVDDDVEENGERL